MMEMNRLSELVPALESALKGKVIAILGHAKDSHFLGEIVNRLDQIAEDKDSSSDDQATCAELKFKFSKEL